MASITIRSLNESVKRRLHVRAAENGRSMEAGGGASGESETLRRLRRWMADVIDRRAGGDGCGNAPVPMR